MRVAVILATIIGLTAARGSAATAIAPGQVTASAVCGTCHRDIYRMWRSSAHADAVENVVFQDAVRDAEEHAPGSRAMCARCHAPIAALIGDSGLREEVTWEGVSCDACHSLVSVDVTAKGPAQVFDPGPVKRGPIPDAASTAHGVAYSPLHATSTVCAGCHEFENAAGTPIMTTYSEWVASSAARQGQTCQDCHMGVTRAQVVDPKLERVVTDSVNLHAMPGGHSLTQLNRSLQITEHAMRQGDDLTLDVTVTNRGAGHAVPTGKPGRRIVLVVGVTTSDGKAFETHRVYTKTYQDAGGAIIGHDAEMFRPDARLRSDTRIMADERRVETFHFPVAATAIATAGIEMRYEHAPGGMDANRTAMTFFTRQRIYPPATR